MLSLSREDKLLTVVDVISAESRKWQEEDVAVDAVKEGLGWLNLSLTSLVEDQS